MTTREQHQRMLDRLAFDTYVDVGLNFARAAYQLGISRQTVRNRVRRESLRIADQRTADQKRANA